jgi:hypothetical protein
MIEGYGSCQKKRMSMIQKSDWVTCKGFSMVGLVERIAKDGTWADVNWGTHSKRMQTRVLTVEHTIPMGNGWEVTDMTRKKELEGEKEMGQVHSIEEFVKSGEFGLKEMADDGNSVAREWLMKIQAVSDVQMKLFLFGEMRVTLMSDKSTDARIVAYEMFGD